MPPKKITKYNSNQRRDLRKTLMVEYVTSLPQIGRSKEGQAGFYMRTVNSLSKKLISDYERDLTKVGVGDRLHSKKWSILFKYLGGNDINKLWNLIQSDKETEAIAPTLHKEYEETAFGGIQRKKKPKPKPKAEVAEAPIEPPPPVEKRPQFQEYVKTIVNNIKTVLVTLGLHIEENKPKPNEADGSTSNENPQTFDEGTGKDNPNVVNEQTTTDEIGEHRNTSSNDKGDMIESDKPQISSDSARSDKKMDYVETQSHHHPTAIDYPKLNDGVGDLQSSVKVNNEETVIDEMHTGVMEGFADGENQKKEELLVLGDKGPVISSLLNEALDILDTHFKDIDPRGENIYQLKMSVDGFTYEVKDAVDRLLREVIQTNDRVSSMQTVCAAHTGQLDRLGDNVTQVVKRCQELGNNGITDNKDKGKKVLKRMSSDYALRQTRAQELRQQQALYAEANRQKTLKKLKRNSSVNKSVSLQNGNSEESVNNQTHTFADDDLDGVMSNQTESYDEERMVPKPRRTDHINDGATNKASEYGNLQNENFTANNNNNNIDLDVIENSNTEDKLKTTNDKKKKSKSDEKRSFKADQVIDKDQVLFDNLDQLSYKGTNVNDAEEEGIIEPENATKEGKHITPNGQNNKTKKVNSNNKQIIDVKKTHAKDNISIDSTSKPKKGREKPDTSEHGNISTEVQRNVSKKTNEKLRDNGKIRKGTDMEQVKRKEDDNDEKKVTTGRTVSNTNTNSSMKNKNKNKSNTDSLKSKTTNLGEKNIEGAKNKTQYQDGTKKTSNNEPENTVSKIKDTDSKTKRKTNVKLEASNDEYQIGSDAAQQEMRNVNEKKDNNIVRKGAAAKGKISENEFKLPLGNSQTNKQLDSHHEESERLSQDNNIEEMRRSNNVNIERELFLEMEKAPSQGNKHPTETRSTRQMNEIDDFEGYDKINSSPDSVNEEKISNESGNFSNIDADIIDNENKNCDGEYEDQNREQSEDVSNLEEETKEAEEVQVQDDTADGEDFLQYFQSSTSEAGVDISDHEVNISDEDIDNDSITSDVFASNQNFENISEKEIGKKTSSSSSGNSNNRAARNTSNFHSATDSNFDESGYTSNPSPTEEDDRHGNFQHYGKFQDGQQEGGHNPELEDFSNDESAF